MVSGHKRKILREMFRNFPEFEAWSEVQVQNRLIPARLGQRLSLYWVIVFNAAASQKKLSAGAVMPRLLKDRLFSK